LSQEAEHRSKNSADGADFASFRVASGRQCVKVAKQFVGAVDQMDFHGEALSLDYRKDEAMRSIVPG